MEIKLDDHIIKRKDIISRVIDNHLLLLSPESRLLFRLNEFGALIWNQLDHYHLITDLLESITDTYQVEQDILANDLIDFLEALRDKNLITIDR